MKAIELEATLSLPESEGRSPGVHISDIIRCIATERGILKPEWAEELSLTEPRKIKDPTAILRMSVGIAWEDYYIPTLKEVVKHPGECGLDGTYGTPDGESVSVIITCPRKRYSYMVHEVKATWKSTKTVGDLSGQSNWMWMAQLKSYCKIKETLYATLHVLFLCGDYSYPIKPQLHKWLIKFDQKELDDNWNLLMDYKRHRLVIEHASTT